LVDTDQGRGGLDVTLPEEVDVDEQGIEDQTIIERIGALVDEEHELHHRHVDGEGLSESEKSRLASVEVSLDQCWDLLRQRRALRDAGGDPAQAHVRDVDVVERYKQ
jgi:hypothetical protein